LGKEGEMGPDLRRRWWRGALVIAVGVLSVLTAPGALAATLSWGPGVGAVPPPDNATVAPRAAISAISCPSAGNCTALGGYVNTSAFNEGILVTESGGTWGNGVTAPLPNAYSTFPGPGVDLTSVSCVSAGNCVAVGNYTDSGSAGQGLILTQTNGSWTGMDAPLPAGANANPEASLSSVDCASSGSCVAVGGYTDMASAQQGVILTLSGGTWTPKEVSLPAGADANPGTNLRSVSCVAAGSCAAVGNYKDTSLDFQGLLLTDNSGTWTSSRAMLPINAAADPAVSLDSVSCVGTLDCAAAGKYGPNVGEAQALLISATSGSWATGTAATLPAGGVTAQPNAISCASAGNCTAVGYYVDSLNNQHGLLLTETAGTWANGVESPVPSGASNVSVLAVSCWAPGNCGAVGDDGLNGLLLEESDGSWTATDATLPSGGSLGDMAAVSCPATAICTAGGQYRNSSTNDDEGLFVSGAAGSGSAGGGSGGSAGGGGGSGGSAGGGGGSGGSAGGASVLAPGRPKVSGQRVSDTMGCRGADACAVTLKLTITEKLKVKGKSERRELVVGRGYATIAGGHVQTVTVTLTAAGKRLLALHRVLVVKLSVIFNAKTIAVYTVTFRAPPHHKK
jgi:hypothetical protein